ncbi:MAG: fibronectin type III domain-containing protein, partial [Bacteroidales bacterium]|nr:fibronectin type III domain-containing protein [Bacteroidales bacterium]
MTKITKQFLLLALLFLPWAAKVQAQCDPGVSSCTISFEMADSYGDGWNDCTISVYQGSTLRGTVTLASGSSGEASVTICSDDSVRLEWFGVSSYPNYSSEASFTVYNGDGIAVTSVSSGANLTSGATFATFMPVCPTCIRPTALTFSDIDSSSATISWTPSGDETSWLLTIGNDTYMVNSTSYSVSDLNAMTAYNVSVRALCSASDTSSALSGSFTTGCGSMPIPYSVDWESIPYNGAWPDCWTRITAYNTDPSVNYNYNHTPGGSYSMYLQASYGYNMFASSKIPLAGDEIYV